MKMQSIGRRTFGNTGLQVSTIGFGAAEIGFEQVPDKTVDTLLGTAIDIGINVVDTAAMYADSEEKIGRALVGRRGRVLLFTKCGLHPPPRHNPTGFFLRVRGKLFHLSGSRTKLNVPPGWHPGALAWNIEQSLRRLKTDHIDLIQLHSCSEETLRREEVLSVLHKARSAGKVLHVGYSSDGRATQYAIQSGFFEAIQIAINIADQRPIDLEVPLANRLGLGVIVKRPLANCLWKRPDRPTAIYSQIYWERLKALDYDFLRCNDCVIETAMRFTMSVPGAHTTLIGTTNPAHILQNAEYAMRGPLEPLQFEAIRSRWKQIAAPDWTNQT